MFSRPHKPFGKGKQITADDLNWLKREATKILVGGQGMNVTRIGGRTVLSRVGSQIVPSGRTYLGNVWKLTSSLRPVWASDPSAWPSHGANMNTCIDVSIHVSGVSAIYGLNGSGIYGVSYLGHVSASGALQWVALPGSGNATNMRRVANAGGSCAANLSFAGVGTDEFTSYVIVDGSENWTIGFAGGSGNVQTFGCGFDGTNYWSVRNPNTSNYTLHSISQGGAILSTSALGNIFTPDHMVLSGGSVFCAGLKFVFPTLDGQFWKMSTSGSVSWKFVTATSLGATGVYTRIGQKDGAGTDCAVDASGNFYGTGRRSNTWTGSGGAYASLWKLDTSGALVWAWDSGAHLYGCCVDDNEGALYVCGDRSNTWDGGSEYKTIWKFDCDGALISSFDFGPAVGQATQNRLWCIRFYNGSVYAASQLTEVVT